MGLIISEDVVIKIVRELQSQGKIIVTTNGSFDILHSGHVATLQKAKSKGDFLIVLLNSDSSVKQLKGPKRPIIPEVERAKLLAALTCVDFVVLFDEEKVLRPLARIKPDIHVKGGTFEEARIKEEKELMTKLGGSFQTFEIVDIRSTTNIIDTIRKNYDL